MRRIILIAVVLALVVPSIFIFTGHKTKDNPLVTDSFMEDVRVTNRGAGKERWTLSAEKVVIPPDGRASRLQNVSINLPEQEMDVISETGVFDLESRDLALNGNVEARTRGYVLKTDSVLLKSGSNEISSKDRVTLEGNNFKIEGDGFRTEGEKKVTLNDNVKATFF